MLNVLHLVLGLKTGGLEVFVLDLRRHLVSRVNSYVACMNYEGELASQVEREAYFPLYRHARGSLFRKIHYLRQYCVRQRIDLIHTHSVGPHLIGALTGFSLGLSVVHTKHGRDDARSVKELYFSKIASLATDSIVAVSQDIASLCTDLKLAQPDRIRVICNGVDVSRFSPPKEHRGKGARVRIGIVARIAQEKNHTGLLGAVRILADRGLSLELVVVGNGPLLAQAVATTKHLGIDPLVHFLGVRQDIPELLNTMDIFVLPSLSEGMPLTLLEAMACGLPVVATKVGGNCEVVLDGVTGILVDSTDSQALADGLALLIRDPDLREHMGRAGRRRVVASFAMGQTAQEYWNLYRHTTGVRNAQKAAFHF
jgi:L-malate glycosyltransferase